MVARILIVDDEASLEKLIRLRFRKKIRAGEFEFLFALNGVEALEIVESKSPIDMVLTDIKMPKMDGLTLLSKLQVVDPTLKAVVVSAYGDIKNIRTAMNQGAFDFLIKPVDFEDLEITIQRTLEHVREIRSNQNRLQEAQTQLVQSEKMSALGQLVSGVAHEINNPLSCIASNLEFLEELLPDLFSLLSLYQQTFPDSNPEIQQLVETIELEDILVDLPEILTSMREGSNRIFHLSKSLRTFSRADNDRKTLFNLHDGINSTLLLLKHRLIGGMNLPNIQVVQEYDELPDVECYPGQLNQVFMNILANAIDAIHEYCRQDSSEWENTADRGKTIVIGTRFLPESDRVLVTIQDNGPGIPEEVQAHVFDHLFTTKAVGKGTGLGLSISRQIVEEKHGGTLRCHSKPGEGAEFEIEIPIAQDE